MSDQGSVSHWLSELQDGNLDAVQPLWERYFGQLVRFARQKLRRAPCRAADEEDVALQAFDSFCRDARAGRFPQLRDRDGLWRLLLRMTAQRAVDLARRECAQKRAGSAPRPEDETTLDQVIGREPTPAFAAQAAEAYTVLLGRLPDESLRSVAVWKLEGYTNEEIGAKLGCVTRTVERMLRVIRSVWSAEAF